MTEKISRVVQKYKEKRFFFIIIHFSNFFGGNAIHLTLITFKLSLKSIKKLFTGAENVQLLIILIYYRF